MKPAPFLFRRAEGLDHALELLSQLGDDARPLAGGQSLLPLMNLRLARPSAVVDISRIPGLSYIRKREAGVQIGALTTHQQMERYTDFPHSLEVLSEAARHIGHHPIRTRGTVGGSLAHADPAAEWCVLMLALGAEMMIATVNGSRMVPSDSFFKGLFETSLGHDELLIGIDVPWVPHGLGFEEYSRRRGDFGLALVAVAFDLNDHRIDRPRVVLGGTSTRPVRVESAERNLKGQHPSEAVFQEAAEALRGSIDPPSDALATAEYRRHLATRLFTRACQSAVDGASQFSEGASR